MVETTKERGKRRYKIVTSHPVVYGTVGHNHGINCITHPFNITPIRNVLEGSSNLGYARQDRGNPLRVSMGIETRLD
jgi:hypothetical protein